MADTKKVAKTAKKSEKIETKPLIAPNTVLKLTIPTQEATIAYNKALTKLARKISLPGFRKGKVPAKIAEENLKPETILEDALQIVLPDFYIKELKKSDYQPLTYPEFNPISLNKNEDWIIEAYIAQRPEINLKGYEKIVSKTKKEADKVIKARVEAEKKHAQECKDEKHNHGPAKLSQEDKGDLMMQYIYKALLDHTKIQIQELLVKEETKHDIENLARQLKQINVPVERFLQQRNMTFEDLSNELAAGALAKLQTAFLIDELAKINKLTVEKSDLDSAFAKIKDEKLRKLQETDPRYKEMMSQTILRQKVAQHLLSIK
jgi:FKBP-type peptidyl-prolyl cis-trans isomerase (trigger factor)